MVPSSPHYPSDGLSDLENSRDSHSPQPGPPVHVLNPSLLDVSVCVSFRNLFLLSGDIPLFSSLFSRHVSESIVSKNLFSILVTN